jgi:hypothetical protein
MPGAASLALDDFEGEAQFLHLPVNFKRQKKTDRSAHSTFGTRASGKNLINAPASRLIPD